MIPMYIVGGPVQHTRISTLGCQLDVAPTVLGMVGRPYDSLFFGHDLLAQTDPSQSRCVMHHNRSIAVYRDQRQVVFGLNKSVELFTGDPKSGNMERVDEFDPIAKQLQQDGTALFQVADDLYMHRAYQVQDLR
jgi:phosphoglycerol transferase MdoB-like AlkP superfamily enzyme